MLFLRILFLLLFTAFSAFHFNRKPAAIPASNNFNAPSLATPQQLAAEGYFGKVLDISPLTIVGNFGEPRSTHFHAGLDFRTNQEVGYAVFAAADGYVSRINVSASGYGNALYITHPNGYVTVYGHLLHFNNKLMQRLRKEQYAKKSFAVDFNLPPNEIKVKKGDTIALSGNTGSTGGPHLHFEIRDSLERVYNPLLFGIKLKDTRKPIIHELKFYPLDELKNKCDGYRAKVSTVHGNLEIAGGTVKLNATLVGFSVNTYDVMNLTDSHTGIYNMTVFDGDKMVYEYQMDRITFPDMRYVLSQVDYPLFSSPTRKTFHKCFVEPGNQCPVYSNLLHAGEINISDNQPHLIYIEISDFAGNVSSIKFKLQHDETSTLFKKNNLKYTTLFDYNHDNEFSNSDIRLQIPKGSLFDNVFFNYSSSPSTQPDIFSKIYQIGNDDTPLYGWFNLSVKTENLPVALADKAVVVLKNQTGAISSRGGKFEKSGFIVMKAREFGTYYVRLDTTAPKIKVLNVVAGKNMRAYKKILVRISDNLSGISNFDTYIDGKWTVTDFDAKSATLTHTLDQNLSQGEHTFKVVVTDERKNVAEYSIKFAM